VMMPTAARHDGGRERDRSRHRPGQANHRHVDWSGG
jgi:hypothetical protein